ncbi:MAG: regulatory protein RecX [Nostocoides sp.]
MNESRASAALDQLRAAVARVEAGQSPGPPAGRVAPVTRPEPSVDDSGKGGSDRAKDPYAVARAIVLRQLTNAPKTRQQLREVLARRQCPEQVAEAVLDTMTEVGLVDDAAYAQLLVRSKQAGRGLARRALRHELRAKGVDDQIAAEVLETIDPALERRLARQLVDKKLATMHGLEVAVQTRRLAGMLARKGYPGDLAWAVIRDALADAPEHQRD